MWGVFRLQGKKVGRVDLISEGRVEGWCPPARPAVRTATVEVLVDGKVQASGPAGLHRADVAAAGAGPANCGFSITLPNDILDGGEHSVSVRRVDDGKLVNGTPVTTRLCPPSSPTVTPAACTTGEAGAVPDPLQYDWNTAPEMLRELRASLAETNGRLMIVYPIIDWSFRWQRPQHITSGLAAAGYTVLWIAHTLHPVGQRYDGLGNALANVGVDRLADRVFRPWLQCARPRNIYTDPLLADDLDILGDSLAALVSVLNPQQVCHLVQLPGWYPLARVASDRFGGALVYDCMDHHAGFSTNAEEALRSEERMIETADLVLASSLLLEKELRPKNPNTLLVKNAAAYTHFENCVPNGKLDHLKGKPIIGYFGAIADWFDIDLVADCARARPDWEFVLIGSTAYCDHEAAAALPNVHFLGEQPFADLPGYTAYFDVCTIPFKIIPLTEATNPVKFYEYMSAGKPVVSTPLPELDPYREHVTIAATAEEFVHGLEQALAVSKDPGIVAQRRALARANDWGHRIEIILAHPIFAGQLSPPARVRASIVLVTYNNLDVATRPCIDSVLANTPADQCEIIIVDNLSEKDETRAWLRDLERRHNHVRVKLNPINKGFSGGNNDGIRMASGDYLVLLNNDTLVPPNWLDALLAPFDEMPDAGLVGPVTNSCGNEQRLLFEGLTEENYEKVITPYLERNAGIRFSTSRLGFFCVAMRRQVVEEVGLLDEAFGVGMFEDDDYSIRAQQKGWLCVVAEDAFVYHKGSVSFSRLGEERYRTLFQRNKAYFEDKHRLRWCFSDMALAYQAKIERDAALATNGGVAGTAAAERIARRMENFRHLLIQVRRAELEVAANRDAKVSVDLAFQHRYSCEQLLARLAALHAAIGDSKVVVFPATIDWTFMAQRPQHLARAFAERGYAVVYGTLSRATDHVEVWERASDAESVFLLNHHLFPYLGHVLFPDKTTYYCLWPNNLPLADLVPHSRLLYDYMDKLDLLELPQDHVEALHSEALKRADLITVSAQPLLDDIPEDARPKTRLIRNGVSDGFLDSARMDEPIAPELKKFMDRPIVGYFGAIAEWFDFDLVCQLAEEMPEVRLVLVGPTIKVEEKLRRVLDGHANIHYFPAQPHDRVVEFLRSFSVGIIPFIKNYVTDAVSPVKLFEYMAGGKPIVTTDLMECRQYQPTVHVAADARSFVDSLRAALVEAKDAGHRGALREAAATHTWARRVDEIVQVPDAE